MNYTFQPMTLEYARLICQWHYEEPYSLYSLEESEECIDEFMNGDYYAGLIGDELIGFICCGQSARVGGGYRQGIYNDNAYLDLGLGMRPDITGRGKGLSFLKEAMSFMKHMHANCTLQLVVASFNERAITVYERAGFHKRIQFSSMIGDQEIQFTLMQQPQHDLHPEH